MAEFVVINETAVGVDPTLSEVQEPAACVYVEPAPSEKLTRIPIPLFVCQTAAPPVSPATVIVLYYKVFALFIAYVVV